VRLFRPFRVPVGTREWRFGSQDSTYPGINIPSYYIWTIIIQLSQPQPRIANRSKALVKSDWSLVTIVTCDTAWMLTLFVLAWLSRVWLIIWDWDCRLWFSSGLIYLHFCIHLLTIFEKNTHRSKQLLVEAASASWPVLKMTSLRVGVSAICPVTKVIVIFRPPDG